MVITINSGNRWLTNAPSEVRQSSHRKTLGVDYSMLRDVHARLQQTGSAMFLGVRVKCAATKTPHRSFFAQNTVSNTYYHARARQHAVLSRVVALGTHLAMENYLVRPLVRYLRLETG